MTNEIFENETTNTELTVVQKDNRFLAIPEDPKDPKELDTFITFGSKAIEAAQAILKKQRISGGEWRQLYEKTKEQGYIVLEAANKLAITVREIPTTSGGRPKKESLLNEAELSEETISDMETVSDEVIRAKKQILEEDFGLTEKQAWNIAKLTVEAVDKEKTYAKDNDEIPLLKHALSFVATKARTCKSKERQRNS